MNKELELIEIPQVAGEIAKQLRDGAVGQARQAVDTLLITRPTDYHLLQLAGAIALLEHRYKSAEALFHRAVERAPDKTSEAMSWNGSGRALQATQQYQRAVISFRQAVLQDPEQVLHVIDFSQALADAGEPSLAETELRKVIQRSPRDPRTYTQLAKIMIDSGRQQDALVMLDVARRWDTNFAPAYFNASVALEMLGKIDAAYEACKSALRLDPALIAYYQLAMLGPIPEEQLSVLRQRANAESIAPIDARIDAGFALAIVLAHHHEYDEAFEYLERANQLKRSTLDFDISETAELDRRLKSFFVPALFKRFEGKVHSSLKPIFIVGMPRSGSTLIEQMLAAHPDVQAGGELLYLSNICQEVAETRRAIGPTIDGPDAEVIADLTRAASEYTKRTAWLRRSHDHFTDKLLGNYLLLGMIHLMFPQSTIIHARREPFDTCLSCYEHLFSTHMDYTYNMRELGIQYRLYEEIMEHWHRVLPPGRILDVDYEAVIARPEQQIRRVLAHCNLPYDPACLNFYSVYRPVTTSSATQVRNPIYQTSCGRWRNYRDHLQPLAEALGRPLPEQ